MSHYLTHITPDQRLILATDVKYGTVVNNNGNAMTGAMEINVEETLSNRRMIARCQYDADCGTQNRVYSIKENSSGVED